MIRGCYCLLNKNEDGLFLLKFPEDGRLLLEWKTRFTLNFAACRGVFSQTFQNNWVNGVLYMFTFNKATKFNLAQPQNVAGEMMRVTDVGTIDEIEASRAKRIMKDVGNGLAIMAYKDQATGQYFKQYVRSNPALLGESVSDNAILTQSEERRQRGTSPLGFAKSFYG